MLSAWLKRFLKAPVRRVAAPDDVVPLGPSLPAVGAPSPPEEERCLRHEDTFPQERKSRPEWLEKVPKSVLAIDVETTGLHSRDRIVSYAGIRCEFEMREDGKFTVNYTHLVFDPGFKGSIEAERIHGYDDWYLRHQPSVDGHLDAISEQFDSADIVVAHNAAFDLDFVSRSFADAGRKFPVHVPYCTMRKFRDRFPGQKSSLAAVCGRHGIERMGERHGALEDAWLALQLFMWLEAGLQPRALPSEFDLSFRNEQPVPPIPDGPLPRRKRRRRGHSAEGGER